jgi:hypothetical protein
MPAAAVSPVDPVLADPFGYRGPVMWSTWLVKRRAVDLCRVGSCLCSG